MLKKILGILLNKYFLTTVAFIVWLVFFDSNNLIMQQDLKSKLKELREEKKFYLDEIRRDSTLTVRLRTDSTELERFAREKYLMKKDNEDVYQVIDTARHEPL
jgi:cell division protein FtsB